MKNHKNGKPLHRRDYYNPRRIIFHDDGNIFVPDGRKVIVTHGNVEKALTILKRNMRLTETMDIIMERIKIKNIH